MANGIVGHGFNGCNLALGGGDRCDTRPYRDPIQVNSASTALSNTASELGAFHADNIPNGPKQRHAVENVELVLLSIYGQGNRGSVPQSGSRCY